MWAAKIMNWQMPRAAINYLTDMKGFYVRKMRHIYAVTTTPRPH